MGPEFGDLGQQRCPAWGDVIGVIMCRRAHRLLDMTGQCGAGDRFRHIPSRGLRPSIQRAVTDKAELAHRRCVALIDDSANRLGKGWMAHPVKDDLCHRAATVDRLEAGFIINRLRQAQHRSALIERFASRKDEGSRRLDWRRAKWHCGVDQFRLCTNRLDLRRLIAAGCRDQRCSAFWRNQLGLRGRWAKQACGTDEEDACRRHYRD